MTTKFAPLRIVGSVALACTLAGACAGSNSSPDTAATSPATANRDAVVRCYGNAYRKRSGVGPVLDDKTDAAAEQLLAKYQGNPKRACEAITTALANSACAAGTKLESVVTCDRRIGRDPNDIDPATKAQIETSVRGAQQMNPAQRGY